MLVSEATKKQLEDAYRRQNLLGYFVGLASQREDHTLVKDDITALSIAGNVTPEVGQEVLETLVDKGVFRRKYTSGGVFVTAEMASAQINKFLDQNELDHLRAWASTIETSYELVEAKA